MVLLENNCAYNEFAVRRYFFVLAFAGLFFSSQDLIAQTFTFDFLIYSDYALNSHDSGLKGKATLYVFSGENEFDQNGNTPYPEIFLSGVLYDTHHRIAPSHQTTIESCAAIQHVA